jgi:hypothetical protein
MESEIVTTELEVELDLEFHEIANGYPMTTDEEFIALVDSIEELGQLENIILYDTKILDGRNRYLACSQLAIKPKTEIFNGTYDEAIALSNAKNGARRHLTKGQKAFTALYAIMSANDRGVRLTQSAAAKIYSVSYKYIQHAMTVYNGSRQLAEAVFGGKMSLTKAYKQVLESKTNKEFDEHDFLQNIMKDLNESEAIRFTELSKLQPLTLALQIIQLEKGN